MRTHSEAFLQDKINARRYRNLIKVVLRAKQDLDKAGLSAKEVPFRIIHPLLESASIEENETVQSYWAGLLVTAAARTTSAHVAHPAYIEILRQLSPEDCKLLDNLYPDSLPLLRLSNNDYDREGMKVGQKIAASAVPMILNVSRLQLVTALGLTSGEYVMFLSPFALRFVMACKGVSDSGF